MNVRKHSVSNDNKILRAGAKLACAAIALLFCLTSAPLRLPAQTSIKSGRKVLTEVQADYPSYLKSIHIEGQVRLDVIVLANGNVSKVEIRGGNPILAENAAKAVMKWKYVPAEKETVEEVKFNFSSH
jgi:TonB family protein